LLKEKEDLQGQLANEKTEGSSIAVRRAELEAQLAIAIQRLAELEDANGPGPDEGDPALDDQDDERDGKARVVLDAIAMATDLDRLRFITSEARKLLYPIAKGRGGRQSILDVERMLAASEEETSAMCLKWRDALRHPESPLNFHATAVRDGILNRRQGPSAILDVIRNLSQDEQRRPQAKSNEMLSQIDNFAVLLENVRADMTNNENGRKDSNTPKTGLGSPLSILSRSIEAVPAVRYALGIAGIAAAVSIITTFANGYSHATLISIALTIIGMFVIYLFSLLVSSKSPSIHLAGLVMMWGVIMFVLIFMAFTTTSAAVGWPCNWALFLNFHSSCESPASPAHP
jgi:hypothetical protein